MNLTAARAKFQKLRQDSHRIRIKKHAWADHPDRGFTPGEIKNLVHESSGILDDNRAASATDGSFVFRCYDRLKRRCELVVLFEEDEVSGELLIVISAFRRVKK